jgi:hypothetical protein
MLTTVRRKPVFLALLLGWVVITVADFAFARVAGAGQVVEAQNVGNCIWDGQHDVAPCMQKAVEIAGAGGSVVRVQKGTWPLSKMITLSDGATLQGEGPDTVLVASFGNSSNPVLLSVKMGSKNITVKQITFDGGGADFANSKPLITGTQVSHVLFDHVTVRNSQGAALLLQGGTSDSEVRDSEFVNIGNHWKTTLARADRHQGLLFCCGKGNTHNSAIRNHFSSMGFDALQIGDQDGFTARDNVFDLSNEQFHQLTSPDYPAAIFALQSQNVLMSGNIIRNAPGNGIDAPGLRDSIISHNMVTGSGSAGIGIFLGYDKTTQSHNVTIVDNTVTNNVQWNRATFIGGISISAGTPSGIWIARNTVTDTQPTKTQKYGIFIRRGTMVSDLKIDDTNKLSGNLLGPVLQEK